MLGSWQSRVGGEAIFRTKSQTSLPEAAADARGVIVGLEFRVFSVGAVPVPGGLLTGQGADSDLDVIL